MARRTAPLFGFAVVFAVLLASSPFAYAHNFSGDESATFIAAIEKIDAHLGLVTQNIGVDDVELAATHAERAQAGLDDNMVDEIAERNERIADELPAALGDLSETLAGADQFVEGLGEKVSDAQALLGEAVSVRIDSEHRSNSTVQALVIAGLADEVLAEYAAAFGEEGEEGEHGHDESEETGSSNNNSNSTEVTDLASLQVAQALTARMGELYAELEAPDGSEDAFAALGDGISELQMAVDSESPVEDVTVITHSQVHDNLGAAFGLALGDDGSGDGGEAIALEGESTTGMFHIAVGWTSADIGSENHFEIEIMDEQGNHLDDATYDIVLLKDGEHIDETHRTNQTATDQHYTFEEQGSYTLRIENINGSGESEAVEIPMQVTPEFPLGAFGIAAAAIGAIVAAGRSRFARSKG
jgi:hypothetical protein